MVAVMTMMIVGEMRKEGRKKIQLKLNELAATKLITLLAAASTLSRWIEFN